MNTHKYIYYVQKIKIEPTEDIIPIINNIDKSIDNIYNNSYLKFIDNEINLLIDIYKFNYRNDYYIEVNTDNYCEEIFIMKNKNYYILTKYVGYIIDSCWYKLDMYFKSFERLCEYLDHQYLKD